MAMGTNKPMLMEAVEPGVRGSIAGLEHVAVMTFGALFGGPVRGRAHARTHARTHARARTRTHKVLGYLMMHVFHYDSSQKMVANMNTATVFCPRNYSPQPMAGGL